jgi:hypothetical protein
VNQSPSSDSFSLSPTAQACIVLIMNVSDMNVYVHFLRPICIISRNIFFLWPRNIESSCMRLMTLTINRYVFRQRKKKDRKTEARARRQSTMRRRKSRAEIEEKIGRSIMKPNLLLLSLRFKGNNVTTIVLMWVNRVISQIGGK